MRRAGDFAQTSRSSRFSEAERVFVSAQSGAEMRDADNESVLANVVQVQKHLKDDSLAARLVAAYAAASSEQRETAIRDVLNDRLEEIERLHDDAPNR